MNELMKLLIHGQCLTRLQAQCLMESLISEDVSAEKIGFILGCYEFRAPNGEELAGFVDALLKRSIRVEFQEETVIDVCGTGGDYLSLFNVSTCVAFVVAAAGINVAKHGNRAVSSRCGSFDVLRALDIPIADNPSQAQSSMENFGMCFLFAPAFHPILRALSQMRRNIGVRTIFNAIGPLLNPARVRHQLIGVYSEKILVPMATALKLLGTKEAMVVYGLDGSDEISLTAKTKVAHLKEGTIYQYEINPEDFSIGLSSLSELSGADAMDNAEIILKILEGRRGPHREMTLINAGAALMVGGKAQDLREGIELAQKAIDSGIALKVLRSQQRLKVLA